MQASTERPKGELLVELRGKNTTTTIKDISPSGVRIESNSNAQVTGKYNAAHMETVTVHLKTDGTSEWETKGIESTPEGDFIAFTGKGKGRVTGPATTAWDGEVHFMTQSPKLSWLNNTKGWVEGTADQVKGEYQGKIYQTK